MEALLGLLPQLIDVVNKGGVVGVMLIGTAVLGWEVVRLRKQSVRTFRQRDAARLKAERYLATLLANDLKVDVSDIDRMFKEDAEEAVA